jgi:hypothetical protein
VLQVDFSTVSSGPFAGATQSDSGSFSGPCGGTVSYSIQYDDVTGVFSGTFTFNSFCYSGVVITGSATVSGTVDILSETFENFRLDFTNLSDGSSTLSGYVDYDFTVSPILVDFDAFFKDNATAKVYWVSNYVMEITEDTADVGGSGFPDWVDVRIVSGQYYDPTYGYIDVVTTVNFRFLEIDNYTWPVSGVLVGTGATPQGAANPTKVQLEALDVTQCRITADLDGDGDLNDYGPETINWADL